MGSNLVVSTWGTRGGTADLAGGVAYRARRIVRLPEDSSGAHPLYKYLATEQSEVYCHRWRAVKGGVNGVGGGGGIR